MISMKNLESIQKISMEIPEPKDYFSGTPLPQLSLPHNIILFNRSRKSKDQKDSKHHRFLLMVNCLGSGEVIINGKRFYFKEGFGILVFPFQHHHYANQEEPMSWLKISFELSSVDEINFLRDTVFKYSEKALELIEKIASCYHLDSFKKPYFASRITFLLAALINEISQQSNLKPKHFENKTMELRWIDTINQYIINNIEKPLSMNSIAKKFHYSESHLRARYRQEMQMSLGAYIQEIRLHKAQEYLGSTDTPISEIAELCGYTSLYVFSNAFKKKFKISPLQFRKKICENSIV